jgi:hypothetical protein
MQLIDAIQFNKARGTTMNALVRRITVMSIGAVLAFAACNDTPTGPNEIGGETNLELTQVGNTFNAYLDAGSYVPGFDRMQDSIVITRNDNGIVTTHAQIKFDSVFVAALDSTLGITDYPRGAKLAVLDTYLKRYGATLDTSDRKAMKVSMDLKMKVTSEGIQEFVNSKGDVSRPFTIVKYSASVGDKYEFTNGDGVRITREVTAKSTTDDYPIGFWMIKVIKVEETMDDPLVKAGSDDPLVEKMIYYANHKFGLVGVVLKLKSGKELKLGLIPPTL